MRIHIWCILAPVFLISVKASLHDNVGQSFYETSQSSSPSPISDYTQSSQPDVLDGMKEIVLYLTPDQVNALQAAGAVVKPYPEDDLDFTSMDQQLPQRIKPETRQHYQMQWNPNQTPQYNTELQNYYKLLNIQEINDNLSQTAAATIRTTERTTKTPRYRFTSTTTRPRFKEREYPTSPAPNRKASRTNYSNQNSNTERTPFQYYYVNQNFRNTPYNIRPLDNSPFSESTFDRKTNPNFYSTPSPATTPSNSNVEHTTHFEFYFENKKFKNTPSNIQVPYNSPSTHKNTPGFYSTPSSEITPNPYYTPSPKSTPNSNIAPSRTISPSTVNSPSPKNTPKPYSTPKPNSIFNFNSSPTFYNTPSRSTSYTYSTPDPYNTLNNFNSATRLQQFPYQAEKIQPNNYIQSNKEIKGNQYDQSPSSTPRATSTLRPKITPSPKNTPKPYSTPSPYKSSTRLPLSRYEPEKEQSNNYFQTSKEIHRNQYHQSPSSTAIPYSTPRPKITPSSKNTPNSYSSPSPYKSSTRLPLSRYEPEKEQPNNNFQSSKEMQGNQYHQSPFNTPTPSPYNSPRSNITPRPNNTPSSYNNPNPYKTPTRLPQSLYQSEEKQSNNYFHSSKEIQENQYHQSPSSTPNPYSTPSPYNKTPTHLPEPLYQSEEKQPIDFQPSEDIQQDQNHQNPSNTPRPYSTPRPYKTPTQEPQSLYQPEEKQSHNFQTNEEIQRKQYQQLVTMSHQNEFYSTTGNVQQKDFTASSTKPHENENLCTEETTEPEQNATQRTVEIGNRKVNKYSARNVYKPPVAVQVQVQEAQESVKPQTLVEVPLSYNAQTLAPEPNTGREDTTERKEPLKSDNDHNNNLSSSPLQEEQETTTTPALPPLVRKPFEEEDYLSLLLAPLYKHRTISEIVSQHKDDLTRSESNVNSKLQYLTNSQLFNTNEHKTGLENLPVDLNEQDGLAKHEAITRSPSVYVDENSETVETSPQNIDKTSEFPIQEHTAEPQDWIASSPTPVPIELIRQFPSEEQVVNIGGARNTFARTEKPFTIQTIAPLRLKHTTPEGLPLDSPILRPIWDH